MNSRTKSINELILTAKRDGRSVKYVSDGYHTFDELYYHRMILFSVICHANKDRAWKSWLHDDGTIFNDTFIVGIQTDEGQYTYHYKTEYWDMFQVQEVPRAPKYDGHKPKDITRLLTL
ncbi:hypothetical protein AALF85_02600 [Jeotgalicoccus halotolerans]|uniref:WDGH domain-containing protein n=1 Tax=Jeotgalicoccus halotolerans TaxID=157227 RepID=UPI003515ACB2